MIELLSGDCRLRVIPELGGAIAEAQWRGRNILRPLHPGGTILDTASFPLAPYSNRVAGSSFEWRGESVHLQTNHPGDPYSPAIHGFSWLQEWQVHTESDERLQLGIIHRGDERWPWSIELGQSFHVAPDGFTVKLSLRNCDTREMPAGLGFHPYFPRTRETTYLGLHRGEWQVDETCLPTHLVEKKLAHDWWAAQPVDTRQVDTVYTNREGPLTIEWPDQGIGLNIIPSHDLDFTTVYVPAREDYFCVEPVSHMTDAFNRHGDSTGLRILSPDEEWSVSMELRPYIL